MLRALVPLAVGASLVLSGCTVHIHPAAATPAQEGVQPAPVEEEPQRDTIMLVHPEPRAPEAPQPIEPRRRVAPDSQPQPPQAPPERRQPIVPQPPVELEAAQFAWACPSGVDPRWVRIALAEAESHRERGDSVTTQPQAAGTPCARAEAPPPPAERPADPRQQPETREPAPLRPQQSAAWVCHGDVDPRWLRVPAQAALAHRAHGDPVSTEPQQAGAPCVRGEEPAPEPQEPRRPEPRRDPRPPQPPEQPQRGQFAWVCHGEENPSWLRVAAAAVEAHREHGDPVSDEEREVGTPCERTPPEPPPEEPTQPEQPEQPEQPQRGQFAWVCHGEENPHWLRVAAAAVEAHVAHGDPVSHEEREVGTPCERTPAAPPPDEPEQPEPPPQPQPGFVWVCHGTRNPTWQRVPAAAAEQHRQHGDPVSTEPQQQGARCERE